MPEGPELCMNSRFVNSVCKGRLFAGRIHKSSVSKCRDVDFQSDGYVITSESRGKELALTLQCLKDSLNRLRLLFRFGMSGKFRFTPLDEVPKHAHLQFFTQPPTSDHAADTATSSEPFVLSFVDVRRFGSWHVKPEGWGENRGPDPMFEYDAFRQNIAANLKDAAFNRPICEAMLNQKYFNGIGNYLRAEILYRVSIPPFVCARKALEPICADKMERDENDILFLCHKVPLEVIKLKQKLGKSETLVITEEDYRAFCQWLQCYENPSMNTARDHNGRTIWFKGEAGVMCPKTQQHKKRRNKRHQTAAEDSIEMTKIEKESGGEVTENIIKETVKKVQDSEDHETSSTVAVKPERDTRSNTKLPSRKRKSREKSGSEVKRLKSEDYSGRDEDRNPAEPSIRRSERLKMTQVKKYTF